MQRVAPAVEVFFDAPRPGDRAAVGQVHVLFQVPAQVLVIVLGQEGCERDFDAKFVVAGIGEVGEIALVFVGGEEDAEFVHGGFARSKLRSRSSTLSSFILCWRGSFPHLFGNTLPRLEIACVHPWLGFAVHLAAQGAAGDQPG